MHDQPQPETLEQRAQQAEKIISNPTGYKICFGCSSIVAAKVTLCPNCHSYRFETDEASIVAQARELGQRERQSVLASDMD